MNLLIGNRLRSLREDKNFMKQDIAHFCNVTEFEVDAWENDESTPEIKHVLKMAMMYNVTIDSMVNSDQSKKTFSTIQLVIYGISMVNLFLVLMHLFSGINGELPLTSMFYREYNLQKVVFLLIIVSSFTVVLVHVLHIINYLKTERLYHQIALVMNVQLAITSLSFMVTAYFQTQYFPNASMVFVLSFGVSISHYILQKPKGNPGYTAIGYRKVMTYLAGVLYFGFAMFEFLMGDSIYDSVVILLSSTVLLGLGIGTLFIPNTLFKSRKFVTIFTSAPTVIFGFVILLFLLFGSFSAYGLLLMALCFMPPVITNLDYIKIKIDARKDQ